MRECLLPQEEEPPYPSGGGEGGGPYCTSPLCAQTGHMTGLGALKKSCHRFWQEGQLQGIQRDTEGSAVKEHMKTSLVQLKPGESQNIYCMYVGSFYQGSLLSLLRYRWGSSQFGCTIGSDRDRGARLLGWRQGKRQNSLHEGEPVTINFILLGVTTYDHNSPNIGPAQSKHLD